MGLDLAIRCRFLSLSLCRLDRQAAVASRVNPPRGLGTSGLPHRVTPLGLTPNPKGWVNLGLTPEGRRHVGFTSQGYPSWVNPTLTPHGLTLGINPATQQAGCCI